LRRRERFERQERQRAVEDREPGMVAVDVFLFSFTSPL
jgi:hypothetical protein